MESLVFFRTENGPVVAPEFIPAQPEGFREKLRAAAQELGTCGVISQGRSGRLADGSWSIWIEDQAGERHNFILYVSDLEARTPRARVSTPARTLGIYEELPGRPQDNFRWIDGSELIQSRFSGKVREVLLEKLDQALRGLGSFDGTIEFVSKGVILRALSADSQVRQFDAEIELHWKAD